MSRVFDRRGNYLGDFDPAETIGGDIWEFLHPGQVQDEYSAVGKEPPTITEIMSGDISQASDIAGQNIQQAAQNVVSAVTGLTQYVIIGGALYLLYRLTKGKRNG